MADRKPINEYDELIQTQLADQQLRRNLLGATAQDPDAYAEAQNLSRKTGVPAPVVQRQPDPVRQRAKINEYDETLKKYPALREILSKDVDAATVVQDDLENMGMMEIALSRLEAYPRKVAGGLVGLPTGLMGAFEMAAEGLEGDGHRLASWGVLPANPFQGLTEWVRGGRQYGAELSHAVAGETPPGAGPTEQAVLSGLESAGMNIGAMGAAIFARSPSLALSLMSTSAGGRKYSEAVDQGYSSTQAAQAAIGEAGFEALTEMLPVGMLFKDLAKGSPFWKTVLRQMALEIPTEQAATVLQDFSDWIILHPDKTAKEFLNERPGAAYQTLIATIVGTGVQTGAVAAVEGVTKRLQSDPERAQSALANLEALNTLTDLMSRSKAVGRDAPTVRRLAESFAGEEAENIYIDATTLRDTLNQEGIDIEQLKEDSPTFAEQFEEALVLGGDVSIPVAEFIAGWAPKEYAEFLVPHMRVGQDSMSAMEAQEFSAEEAKRYQEEAEAVLEGQIDAAQLRDEREQIRDLVEQQIKETKRFPDDVAPAYAELVSSFFTATAARMGLSPLQLLQRSQLQVESSPLVNAIDQGLTPQAYQAENAPAQAPEGYTRFRHFGKMPVDVLSPAFMGTGIRGEEQRRGPNRENVLSLYPDTGFQKEVGLGNVEYVIDIPNELLYDIAEDPLKLSEQAQEATTFTLDENGKMVPAATRTDFNQLESLVRQAGFFGYRVPESDDNLSGQARIFGDVAVRDRDYLEASQLAGTMGLLRVALQYDTHLTAAAARAFDLKSEDTLFQLKEGQEPEGFDKISPFLTEEEKAALNRSSAQTLIDRFNDLPDTADFTDTALAGLAKRGWYRQSTKALLQVFGLADAPQFVALLAALSPQTSVRINFENALLAWTAWDAAGRPTGKAEINEVLNQSVGRGQAKSVLDAWRNNAVTALSSENPLETMLSGPKVDSFMRNLMGDMNQVTNDAWMATFAFIDQALFAGSATKSGPGKRPGYLAMSAKVRQAAAELGWTPAEVQETIWSWVKTAYELADIAGETRTVEELVAAGAVTDEKIADTPAFGDMITGDASLREILEAAGYSEQLAAVEKALRDEDTETADDATPAADRPGTAATTDQRAGAARVTPALLNTARRLDQVRRYREEQSRLKSEALRLLRGAAPRDGLPERFVTLSAERYDLSPEENAARMEQMEQALRDKGFEFQRGVGMYKGTGEGSFLVTINNARDRQKLARLAHNKFNQESILEVDKRRNAQLQFGDGKTEDLGTWLETRDTVGLDAWTEMDGRQFTTKKLTPKEKRGKLNQDLPLTIGMYSAVGKAVQDMNLPEWKTDKPASGNSIWQKITKMPGVKQEEIAYLGLEEFLTGKVDGKVQKFTREQVQEYVDNGGPEVIETVADQEPTATADTVDWVEVNPRSLTEQIDWTASKILAAYDEGGSDYDHIDIEAWLENWASVHIEEILDEAAADNARARFDKEFGRVAGFDPDAETFNKAPFDQLNFMESQIGIDWPAVSRRLARDDFKKFAADEAARMRQDAPFRIFMPEQDALVGFRFFDDTQDRDFFILQENPLVWAFYSGDWRDGGPIEIARSEAEIKILANEYLRQAGFLEQQAPLEEIKSVEQYFRFGREVLEGSYREVKLKMPEDAYDEPFTQTIHFQDKNILVSSIVTDANLPMSFGAEAELTYVIQEGQSDLHTLGRTKGYKDENVRLEEIAAEHNALSDELVVAVKKVFDGFVANPPDEVGYMNGEYTIEIGDDAGAPAIVGLTGSDMVTVGASEFYDYFELAIVPTEDWQRIIRGDMTGRQRPRPGQGPIPFRRRAGVRIAHAALQRLPAEQQQALREKFQEMAELDKRFEAQRRGAPPAPFKDDAWISLMLKRALLQAAENGYWQFAWSDSNTIQERWSDQYDYTAQYDRKMPSIVRKLTGQKPVHIRPNGRPMDVKVTWEDLGVKSSEFFGPDYAKNHEVVATYEHLPGEQWNILLEKNSGEYKIAHPTGGYVVDQRHMTTLEEAKRQAEEFIQRDNAYPGYWVIELTDEVRERILGESFPLFQETRGQISMPQGGTGESIISLLNQADLSTFLHESGHFFLEVTAGAALQVGGPMREDMDTLLEWFGFEGTLEDWMELSIDERRAMHEQFARGFERYLFEGKAPNQELRSLFQRFRQWLIQVYRNVANLNVELTDEVRAVMDRMVATEDQIKAAQQLREMDPLFSQKPEDMSEQEWLDYQALAGDSTERASEELQRRALRDMKWLRNARSKAIKALQREARTKRKVVKEEVRQQMLAEPPRVAEQLLKKGHAFLGDGKELDLSKGPHKLSVATLEADYGTREENAAVFEAAGFEAQQPLWARLPTIYKTQGDGLDADTVARLVGLTSGDQLIRALLDLQPFNEELEARTDAAMIRRYGDLSDQEAIERAADEAVHNELRIKLVAREARALENTVRARQGQEKRGTFASMRRAAKEYAESIVNRRKIRDVKPHEFSTAAARAARSTKKAMEKDDLRAAASAKRSQLLNENASRYASKVRTEIDRAVRYLNKFNRKNVRSKLAPEYVDQIDTLLERVDIRQRSLQQIDNRKSLREWIEEQEAQGFEPAIDDRLRDEAYRKHYKDMTVEEFRGLVDAVKTIEHLGRLKNKLLKVAAQRRLDEAVEDAVNSIEENAHKEVPDEIEHNRFSQRLKAGTKSFFAMHRKMSNLLREMDGWKDGGVMWELFTRPLNDAGNAEAIMRAEATAKLIQLFEPVKKNLRRTMFIREINASLSKEGRLAIALNWGNPKNRQRIMDGDRWTEAQVQAILDTLTKEEWDFVQAMWDFVDSYWAQIAEKEKRVYGVAPEKVDAMPVQTRFGEYRGGYYPIDYDPLRSSRAEADSVAEQTKNSLLGLYTRAQTKRGHTKKRVEEVQNRPVRKDLGVVFKHVTDVIHDLTHHEMLIDLNRLLGDSRLDAAIRKYHGPEVLRQLRQSLEDVATGDAPARDQFERVINHLRTGATIAGLGYNLMTSALQPIGLTQSWVRIGPKWVAKGLSRWLGDAARMENAAAWVREKSDFMKIRQQTMQREISEIQNKISGKDRPFLLSTDAFFFMIQKLQLVADLPTWIGAYEKAMDQFDGDEAKAIALADQAVLDSQGGGQVKDLAAVQRGGPLMKLFTNFYSFFNTTYNMAAEVRGRSRGQGVKGAGRAAVDYLMLFTVPAVLGSLLYDLLRGDLDDWDDPEEVAKRLTREQIAFAMSTVVGLRELGSALQGYSYRGPAGLRVFAEASNLIQQAEQGELDEAALKALNNTAGIVFHYPAGQVQRTVEGVVSLAEGTTENPLAIFTGPPKE